MHIYGTLSLVLATALTCETAWNSNHGDFGFHRPARDWRGPFGSQRPHGPYGSYGFHGLFGSHRPHGPRYFHPPHHQYKLPHHEPCDWFRRGGSKDHWQNKAPRPPPPPPATPATTSTSITPPNIKKPNLDCVLDCLKFTNPEDINPVCGSNGVSYRNSMTLKCVNDCGEDVTLVHRHRCEKVGGGSTIETSNGPPEGPELDSILTCLLRCPTTPEYNPVCGSDGLTYANPGRLECAKMCGRNVEVSKYTRCLTGDTPKANTNATLNPNSNATSNPNSNATSTPNSNAIPATASTSITPPNIKKPNLDCVLNCRMFTNPEDINPVCGSNGVSYRNSMTLKCVSDCGEDVTLVHRHKCEKVGGGSTIGKSNGPPEGPELDSILTCMLRCPTTPEYNPVCGSDGLTYANPGRLECAKMCGRDVDNRCPTGDITPKANTNATPNPNSNATTNPNSNATTNPNSNATSNSNSNTTSTPVPVTAPPPITNVTPNQNLPSVTPANQPDFTIPQDILDQIFTQDYNSLINVRRD